MSSNEGRATKPPTRTIVGIRGFSISISLRRRNIQFFINSVRIPAPVADCANSIASVGLIDDCISVDIPRLYSYIYDISSLDLHYVTAECVEFSEDILIPTLDLCCAIHYRLTFG